mgnify:FL=1
MGPIEAFTTGWRKSFNYGGKATRSEYWWFIFTSIIATIMLFVLVNSTATDNIIAQLIFFTYTFAQIFPSISIGFRRIRDIGKSWGWYFVSFIPFIGGFWFIALMCQPSGHYGLKKVSDL